VKVELVKVWELEPQLRLRREVLTVPQGGLPWVAPVSAYSIRKWTEYTQEKINRRLIDHRKLMAGFKNVSFTAARVQQFVRIFAVDLFSQSIYVNLDNV
jgi:hypothetical protein